MAESFLVNGVPVDRVAAGVVLTRCTVFAKNSEPSLSFAVRGGNLIPPGSDPHRNARIDYTEPGGVYLFAGDVQRYADHYDHHLGWVREYESLGLRARANHIPVTDEVSLTDTIRFNLPADDPDVLPSRQGRTVAQMVLDVLEMPINRAALSAAGIGAYTSAGSGAIATASVSGGVVTVAVSAAGSGYTTAPTVFLAGGGGTYTSATATMTGTGVLSVAVVGSTGYRTAPVVVFSTLPASTLADLDSLFIVPAFEVTFSGERILQSIEAQVANIHPNHFLHVEPGGAIRFLDPRTFAGITLTLGAADRVDLPTLTRDWSQCYTAVEIRGYTRTQGFQLGILPFPGSTLADAGLSEDFAYSSLSNSDAKDATQWNDFLDPLSTPGAATATATISSNGKVTQVSVGAQGYGYVSAPTVTISGGGGTGATATATLTADKVTSIAVTAPGSGFTSAPNVIVGPPAGSGQYDQGTCTCPSTTTVRITSSNAAATWAANAWDQSDSGKHGTLEVISNTLTGFQQRQQVRVLAHPALTAGGTCDLTIDQPLPSTSFDSYKLYGLGGGAANVGRKYLVTEPTLRAHLRQRFAFATAYRNAEGNSASLTSTATGTVIYRGTAIPAAIVVEPESGHIYFDKPVQFMFSPNGKTVVWPDDVQVFVPVQIGVLSARYPSSGYAGTAYSVEGISRLKRISANDWRDYSNQANMDLWAQETWSAVSDTVVEGSIVYAGKLDSCLLPGKTVSVTGDTYTTGWESLAAPVVACNLTFHETGGSGTSYTTTLNLSNRRAPYSGAVFARPGQSGQMPLASFEGGFGSHDWAPAQPAGLQVAFGQASQGMAMLAANQAAQPMAGPDMGMGMGMGMGGMGLGDMGGDIGAPDEHRSAKAKKPPRPQRIKVHPDGVGAHPPKKHPAPAKPKAHHPKAPKVHRIKTHSTGGTAGRHPSIAGETPADTARRLQHNPPRPAGETPADTERRLKHNPPHTTGETAEDTARRLKNNPPHPAGETQEDTARRELRNPPRVSGNLPDKGTGSDEESIA